MELEETVLQLLQHIRVLRNHARPIGCLPPELLSMIFDLVATPPEYDSTPTLRDVISLTHVCRYWRTVLLNHNGVWSDVHLKGQDPGLVVQQLKRCGDAALSVNVHLQFWMFRRENIRLLNNLRETLTDIRLHRNQVRRLVVHIACCQIFHQYFNFDLPNLEELVWEDLCVQHATTHSSNPPDPEHNRMPRLRHLSVKKSLHWPVELTSGLTTFKLEGHMVVAPEKLTGFLRRNPALETLELINLHVPYNFLPDKAVELDHLTRLSIQNVEHGHIFPYIALPALKGLEIGPFDQPPRWVGSVWFGLQVPSGITALTITYHGFEGDRDKISVVGFDNTSNQLLALTEHTVGRRFTPVLGALANASLALVTTLYFDEEGQNLEGGVSSDPILALLRSLPRLRRVGLGWGHLTSKVFTCLNDHRQLCPELKDLRVKVTRQTYFSIFGLVRKLVQSRADAEQWLSRAECFISEDDESDAEATRRLWDSQFQRSNLTSLLRDA